MISRSYNEPDAYSSIMETYTHVAGPEPPTDKEGETLRRVRRGDYEASETPGWHAVKHSNDLLVPKGYTRFDYVELRGPGAYGGRYHKPSTGQIYDYAYVSPRYGVEGMSVNKAMAEFYSGRLLGDVDSIVLRLASAANAAPSFDVSTFLAEVHKTKDMVLTARSRAQKLIEQGMELGVRAARGIKHSSQKHRSREKRLASLKDALRAGMRTAQLAGDARMEWRYGWRLLGYDIQDIHDLILYPIKHFYSGQAAEVRGEVRESVTHSDGYYVSRDIASVIEAEASLRCRTILQIKGETLNALGSLPVTLWELIPYSFVADWFVNVGEVFKAWEVMLRADRCIQSFGISYTESGTATVVPESVQLGVGAYATAPYYNSGTSNASVVYRRRHSVGPLNINHLIPRIRVELTSDRLLDAATILAKRII
jgi:hypothetical protein